MSCESETSGPPGVINKSRLLRRSAIRSMVLEVNDGSWPRAGGTGPGLVCVRRCWLIHFDETYDVEDNCETSFPVALLSSSIKVLAISAPSPSTWSSLAIFLDCDWQAVGFMAESFR